MGLARDLWTHYPAYAVGAADTWQGIRERFDVHARGRTAPVRALEVGCGAQYPYVVLFHSAGVRVVGIDIMPLARRNLSAGKYLGAARSRGPLGALKKLAGDAAFHLAFYRPLAKASRVAMRHAGTPLVRMDATRCGFPDATFDFVYSSACFEHLSDVDTTVAEIDRVLKPGGVAEIEIHLFPSMTGGHESELFGHRPPPAGFRVWSHLLDPDWRAPLYLNRWREPQFREAFAKRFDVADRLVTSAHGEQYLTGEIQAALADRYTRAELTTESVLYVLRKRG